MTSGSHFTLPSNARQTPSASSSPSGSGTSSPSSPPLTGAPEILGMAGALETNVNWPLKGAPASHTEGAFASENFSASGFVIDGVRWTWPSNDSNPANYIVVPTVMGGKPYLVWTHLGAHKGSGIATDPRAAASLWMTPWSNRGGSLAAGAALVTNDIPPLWSTTGQWNFAKPHFDPTGTKTDVTTMAQTAWTGWFHWGRVATAYTPSKGSSSPTVAWPSTLSPAYNGVVLVVHTHLQGANQGLSSNVYYLNLKTREITGLASLTNGGGFFEASGAWNDLVVTGESTDATPHGPYPSCMVAYNEVTGKRQVIHRPNRGSATFTGGYEIVGNVLRNQNGAHVATLDLSVADLYGPTPNPFAR